VVRRGESTCEEVFSLIFDGSSGACGSYRNWLKGILFNAGFGLWQVAAIALAEAGIATREMPRAVRRAAARGKREGGEAHQGTLCYNVESLFSRPFSVLPSVYAASRSSIDDAVDGGRGRWAWEALW
jgi:hypothetical protein